MTALLIMIAGLSSFAIVYCVLAIIWTYHPCWSLKWLFHDILKWHEPGRYFEEGPLVNKCRFCGRKVRLGSKGRWMKEIGKNVRLVYVGENGYTGLCTGQAYEVDVYSNDGYIYVKWDELSACPYESLSALNKDWEDYDGPD